MAGDATSQLWLTHALNDDEVASALTLAFSLKKVLTGRKLAVLVSPKVSLPLREALHLVFDFFFYVEEERNTAGLKIEDFAKLSALTFRSFEKIAFLPPTMMVLKNSDEIFNECNSEFQRHFWGEKGSHSIFVVRPCSQTFKVLINELRNINGNSVEQYLRTWTKNQSGGDPTFLGSKYCHALSSQKEFLLEKGQVVSMINLADIPTDVNVEKYGIFSKLILENRKMLYKGAVKPLLQHVMENPNLVNHEFSQPTTFNKEPIAIVGMSCRYPSANNLEEFWNLLVNAEDGTGNPPDFRWRREQSTRNVPQAKNTNAGFLKCPVDDFDAKFFNISPKEMVFLDPQHRLLHELVWEGLEDAAIVPESLVGTNGGVFIGSWTADYKDILRQVGNDEFYRMYMGNSIGASAARISHFLGMTGPSIATESGCSSAMVAVHLACKSLQRGESSFALACGVNLLLQPFDKDLMPMVISPDGHSKTFDANANGYARGEGCGVLVLKRLSDAVRDEDKIWALIRGTGMKQEGVSKSMGTPTVQCESMAMTEALQDARVSPAMVSYVEAHGTGTTVGDPMEVAAIAKAYHSNERKEPLLIGSVKTNVGHTESCSGITGIMKVVLAMNHEIIPAHRNFETLNPSIDLDAVPAQIPLEPVEWKKRKGAPPRMAGVSSFGITGTDAHVIIEEAPELPAKVLSSSSMERPFHLMKITAKTDEALDILVDSYKNHLSSSETDLPDLAYTANTGRANFSQRAVIIAKSKEDAVKIIEPNKLVKGEASQDGMGKVCFLFTGQGSQYPGMGKQLYETSPVFRSHFEYCEKLLKNNYNIDITQVLWSEAKSAEVSRTIYSQTSIFCVEYALLKLWESWGVKPDFALGHSLGEFAAAVCAGILSVEDALKLVAERSRLIDNLPRGKMLVIKANKQEVDTLMKKFAGNDSNKMLDYAAINSPDQTVVAGNSEVVLQFSECCKKANLKCIILEATHAFHSKHMDPMLDAYRKVAKTVKKLDGNDSKYISGMRGSAVEAERVDAEYWVEHTREKVLFMDASKKAVELGCKTFIEIGPQPVLSALTMMNNDQALSCLASLRRNENEWETLLNTLGKLYVKGLEIDWKGFEQLYNRQKVSLPHYPFIGKKYWPDLQSITGSSIHPLVGSVLPNASSAKLFQTGLNLRSLEWVKDHAIGDRIIFPGAGYLEMCLAAGLATVEGSTELLAPPTRPMKVENLSIQAPLCLEEAKTTQVQTVVEFNMSTEKEGDWNDMKVNIFRRVEAESTKWFPHAQATFSPIPTAEDKAVSIDAQTFLQTQTHPSNDEFITEVYNKLASLGLKFGPNFRSLEKFWKDEEKGTIYAKVKLPSGEESGHNQYIIHPVILDAMIQSIMMLSHVSNLKRKLYIPISIGKFVWLSASTSESADLYIYGYTPDPSSTGSALLLDSAGHILAVMSSVEFIDTTVKAIDAVIEQQTSSMPDLWEEVWKPSLGPLQHRAKLSKTNADYRELDILSDDFNDLDPYLNKIFEQTEKLVYVHMLISLYECGWKPTHGEKFSEESLHSQLGIQKNNRQYFGFMLEVLEAEGFLEKVCVSNLGTEIEWKVVKIPPSITAARELLATHDLGVDLPSKYSTTPLFNKVGENLSKIMKGEQIPLSILFPDENAEWPSVAEYYTTYSQMYKMRDCISSKCSKKLAHVKAIMGGKKFVFRILEVGAGTGSYTDYFLSTLDEVGIEFEYTYTDISAAFFPAAEKRFQKYAKSMKFKKLNIEEDPIEQGFTPEYYDLICASDVIHTTKNIRDTLRNIRMLMAPNGALDIQEMTGAHRFVTFLFGLLDGFWRFEDFALRPRHCTLTPETWVEVLISSGFKLNGSFPMINNHHSYIWAVRTEEPVEIVRPTKSKVWLVFQEDGEQLSTYIKKRMATTTTRKVITVHAGQVVKREEGRITIRKYVEEDYVNLLKSLKEEGTEVEGVVYCWALDLKGGKTTQEEILRPYFYLTKSMLTAGLPTLPRVVGLTSGSIPVGENEVANFPLSTIWGYTKTLKNENHVFKLKLVDMEEGSLNEAQLEEVFCELWNSDGDIMLANRDGTRYHPKFQSHKCTHNPLSLPPGTDRFSVKLPESRAISDLTFRPLDMPAMKEDEVVIQVKASALNFRDVLSVLKPSEEFKDINMMGFDFAGVVKRVGVAVTRWKAGDRIIGCNIDKNSALPSHVLMNQDLIIPLPEEMTFAEAATIPAVYITSVVCLLEVAKIKKGDIILLHTATGGVGLSAIEICKHVGATIIATAGSKRKQNYLRSIGIQHIFHSRNTKFGDQILELTNGRGVDVVLNSLTSEGFKEATLKACAKEARFVEMSKLNIWTVEEVKKLRPDVDYTIVDISASDSSEWSRFMDGLRVLMGKGVVKPVPYIRFDSLSIRDALQYMQKAKHIGKIVCTMPEMRNEGGEVKVHTPVFNYNSTYLITGGLGGIGLAVCSWMVEKGAKHVILASRSPPNSTIQAKISELNSKGVNVIPVQLDVANFEQCKELIQTRIPQLCLPALRGVMHAAGIINDGLIVNQTWSKLVSTFNTKVHGSLNLHELTKNLNLEHFVMFSSIAALFGSPGQCNHSAGNCFEDALIYHRQALGLPGTTVSWGQWGEVGVATEVDIPGMNAISTLQGLTALDYALNSQRTSLAVINVDSFQLMSKLFPHFSVYLDKRIWKTATGNASHSMKSEEFWELYHSKSDAEERLDLLKDQLKIILRGVLKLDDCDTINEDGNFQEMGVDSLMFVEIKNHLQGLLGDKLIVNVSALKDCNTINLLAQTLVNLIQGDSKDNLKPPTMDEVNQLIFEDCQLPDEIAAKPGQEAKNIGQVSRVLLTGVTGLLGPYILKELVSLPQISEVVCLIRPRKNEGVEDRLRKALEGKSLLSLDMSTVRCVRGDIAEPHLGLEQNSWEELSQNMDAVFNCAASVLHTELYRKRATGKDMRAVNVGGIRNILEFATETQLKLVYHASSIVAVAIVDEEGRISERWPEMGEYDNVTTFGYPISKYVGDMLMKQAVERGIPAKIFRLPLIVGEKETGRCSMENNHALLRFMFIMKNGIIPSAPHPWPVLPVDECARVSVRIFFDERATSTQVFNVTPAQPDTDQQFVVVAARFGHKVDIVELSEFTKRIQEAGDVEGEALGLFKDFYSDESNIMKLFTSAAILRKWLEGGEEATELWRCKNVVQFIPDYFEKQEGAMDYFYRDLSYCKSQGWFKKFGL